MTNESDEFRDDRPRQDSLDVGDESLRTADREGVPVMGSGAFVDDRDTAADETVQSTLTDDDEPSDDAQATF